MFIYVVTTVAGERVVVVAIVVVACFGIVVAFQVGVGVFKSIVEYGHHHTTPRYVLVPCRDDIDVQTVCHPLTFATT